jgi:DNA-binding response OmpR family regulator
MYTVLIIEDDVTIAQGLAKTLVQYGLNAVVLNDFQTIDQEVKRLHPHLILLDINLPYYNGFYWCTKIRKVTHCPILILSARDGATDQVMALENGADDYICKPFYNDVVIAKVRSHLRRNYGDYKPDESNLVLLKEGLQLDKGEMHLMYKHQKAYLSHKEVILLETLLQQYPNAATREQLLERVWDSQDFVDENTLNVNITRIRKKLEEIGLEGALETVRGYGYKLQLS